MIYLRGVSAMYEEGSVLMLRGLRDGRVWALPLSMQ